jgi:NAD(P)-dependent dehydrogenase (short-subunit alcohol dehydrogenase family)
MNDIFNLNGKVALITGAASGIGAKCVEVMAQCGAKVMATDIDEQQGLKTVAEFKAQGLDVAFCQHDASSSDDWDKAITATLAQFNGLDILINNAGIYIGGTLLENNLEQLQRLNKINVESLFLGMKAAATVMKPGGNAGNGGSIINLSSVAGLIGVAGHSAYGATKGAARLYSKHAAVEFAQLGYGIRVNSVHPGVIDTEMGGQVFQDLVDIGLASSFEEAKKIVLGMTPLGRLGKSEDIASMIAFLSSDAASFVTGGEFVVDGGLTAT